MRSLFASITSAERPSLLNTRAVLLSDVRGPCSYWSPRLFAPLREPRVHTTDFHVNLVAFPCGQLEGEAVVPSARFSTSGRKPLSYDNTG